jgi:hypothetical protein
MTDNERPSQLPGFELGTSPRLQALLVGAGWALEQRIPERLEYWSPSGSDASPESGIVVPLDESRGDYDRLYQQALAALRRFVGPPAFERLAVQIDTELSQDLVRTSWRREADTEPGTIPWQQGRELFEAITKQLVAAAKAAVEPQALLGRANAFVAQDFLSTTILAPSGTGSYVVNALTPVHRHIYLSAPVEPKPGRVPKERQSIEAIRVLATLDAALSAVSRGLEETEERDQVEAIVASTSRGVSRELLEAVAEFSSGRESAVILPRQAWSADARPHEVAFEPKHTKVLQAAAAALTPTTAPTTATVTGVVTKLEHEPESDRWAVRLFTTSQGPVRRVTLWLDEGDYDRAIAAHSNDSLVRVRGRLAKEKKYWTITDPDAFVVLDADDDSGDVRRERLFKEAEQGDKHAD